jgi:DNA polymerase-1
MEFSINPENTPEYFELKEPNLNELRTLYTELEFKAWLQILNKTVLEPAPSTPDMPPTVDQTENVYHIILSKEQLAHWIAKLKKTSLVAICTKTTSLNYMSAQMVGIAFAIKPHEAIYIPFAHDYMDTPSQLERNFVLEALKPLLEDANLLKVGQNIKYDIEVLANHNICLSGVAFDTMLESYIVHSTSGQHTIDVLAQRILKHTTMPYHAIAGKGVKEIPFNQIPIETAGPYAAEEVDLTLQVHQALWATLKDLPKQKHVLEAIEMPLVPVLARMERQGVLIDAALLGQQSIELQHRMQVLEQEIFALANQTFNLNSPKQLQEILFTKLKYPILEKTPLGQASTSESVLQELALTYPVAALILEYRSISKLKSTYTDALPTQIHPQTGRVHTSYQQAVTSTGRLSSTDPNLQNIPIRGNEGRKIRSAFIAPPGKKIVAADYSQIELRIMAHLSQDKGLQQAFEQDVDIHKMTAAGVFNVPLQEVNDEQRRQSKAINFGLMYGMSVFGLAKQLGIPQEEAKKTVDNYFNCFPGVKHFMDKTRQAAFESGYVETVTGRRLYLPDLKSSKMNIRKAAERAAINAPMQGTNADIIKLAMIQIDHLIQAEKWDMHMIMQVHDELVFEIHESIIPMAIAKIKEVMENVIKLSVKLHVNIGVADNWEAAH